MSVIDLSRKLFVLPGVEILAVLYSILAVISFIFELRAFLFLLILTATIVLAIKLLKLRFNAKRVLFLSILVSTLSFLSFAISGSFSGSFFLLLAVIYFCSERGLVPSVITSSIPFLILEPMSIIVLILSTALFFAYLRILSISIGNSTLREFVESFVKFWLTNNPEYAEEILKKNAEIFKGRLRCLKFNDFKFIATDFHPGPFRNVGGARLVNILNSPDSVYLHSPTSHERDPVSEDDLRIIRDALKFEFTEIFPMKPFKLESENFKILCFPFDKIKLILVSGKRRIDSSKARTLKFYAFHLIK